MGGGAGTRCRKARLGRRNEGVYFFYQGYPSKQSFVGDSHYSRPRNLNGTAGERLVMPSWEVLHHDTMADSDVEDNPPYVEQEWLSMGIAEYANKWEIQVLTSDICFLEVRPPTNSNHPFNTKVVHLFGVEMTSYDFTNSQEGASDNSWSYQN